MYIFTSQPKLHSYQISERFHLAIMKGAITFKGPTVKVIDAPIPRPQAGQVTIKVVYSGCNPKDW